MLWMSRPFFLLSANVRSRHLPRYVVHVVEWRLSAFEGTASELSPLVDGCPLVDLAAEYEQSAGYKPAGGYAGLVLDYYRFGNLRLYLMGEQQDWPGERVPLLGCDSGEWGSSPAFRARVPSCAGTSSASHTGPRGATTTSVRSCSTGPSTPLL